MAWNRNSFFVVFLFQTINEIFCEKEIFGQYSCEYFIKPGYLRWIQIDNDRPDLFCPNLPWDNLNFSNPELAKRVICSCCSVPSWKHSKKPVGQLQIEYLNRRGESFLRGEGNETFHIVHNEEGYLSTIPFNICLFPTIVEILLKRNRVKHLPSLTCLIVLDTIDLSYNQLKFISNTSFYGLKNLRRIDFSHNLIREIEPFTFNHIDHGIMMADFSFNELRVFDITNVFALKSFCYASYKNNGMTTISNKLKYRVFKNQTFGQGGYINLAYNKIQRLPDPAAFGMSLTDIGKFSFNKYFINLSYNELICDCGMEAFLKDVLSVKDRWSIAGKELGLYCYYPSNMRETLPINELLSPSYLDRFICNATSQTRDCDVYFQPSQDRIVINCTSADFSILPEKNLSKFVESIPYEETRNQFLNASVHAIFHNNSIRELRNTSYIRKTHVIDLSSNKLHKLQINAIRSLPTTVDMDISNNPELRTLPRHLQRMNSSSIHINGLSLSCTCEDEMYKWLPDWLPQKTSSAMECSTGRGKMFVRNITADILECHLKILDFILTAVIPLIFATTFVATLFFCSYKYKYEIYVLYRQNRHNRPKDGIRYLYDIYISLDESHPSLTRWIVSNFLPMLQRRGYKTYVPLRDMMPGDVREECIVEAMNTSRCTIVFLTKSLCDEDDIWMDVEWRNAWKHFKSDLCSKLIVVNFDLVPFCMIPYPSMKAVLRLGDNTLRFSSTRFIDELIKKLGPPIRPMRSQNENRKPIFNVSQLEARQPASQTDPNMKFISTSNQYALIPVKEKVSNFVI